MMFLIAKNKNLTETKFLGEERPDLPDEAFFIAIEF